MAIKFITCKSIEEVGIAASSYFIKQVKKNSNSTFVLATGSSPIVTYQKIVNDHITNKTDWSKVITFNLDEYIGLKQKYFHQSYRHFMDSNLFNLINIKRGNTHFPTRSLINGKYLNTVENNIDIALLGIGNNGHIAFNEPGTDIQSKTHIVNLTQSSRLANSRFFDNNINNVPKQAVTMGLAEILKAKKIILIATGKSKRSAINVLKKAKKFNKSWPVTALTTHCDVVVITDLLK